MIRELGQSCRDSLQGIAAATAILAFSCVGCSDSQTEASIEAPAPPSASTETPAEAISENITAILDGATVATTAQAPGLEDRGYVAPLADSYSRIDPEKDGWNTEAFHEAANAQLGTLAKEIADPDKPMSLAVAPDFVSSLWAPETTEIVKNSGPGISIHRMATKQARLPTTLTGIDGMQTAARGLVSLFAEPPKVKFKHYRIEPRKEQVHSRARLEATGESAEHHGKAQVTAEWDCVWTGMTEPRLLSIQLAEWEFATYQGASKTVFEDRTTAVLGQNPSFHEQLLQPTDHWRSRLPRDLGLDVVANHGLALGDINGDRLDDLYLCMQGGLPNRLYLRNPGGTLTDVSEGSGADWLDYCASALIVDFDNDGDGDLVVGQEWRILFMENMGEARFELAFGLGTRSQTFSLAAADYDVDGDVDVYVCGYNPPVGGVRTGAMGEPLPYHDAQNGGANMLLRNDGNWEFNEATAETGLEQNNNRFSFAAAWEDYDNDGDLDLYVANDYGRNNLYQNNNGKFHDVAEALGLEDMSSGMSVAWGDYNRDGWMDLYVSNMFSAAGNRITYQRQFKTDEQDATKAIFQRHARGNTLFESTGQGQFRDVSEEADVTMGRWAWGSAFVDINNDSWQDIIVANGFITTEDTGDL